MREFILMVVKNIIIGLLPTAYYIILIFTATFFGIHIIEVITFSKIIIIFISIKIVTIEFALNSYLYRDRKERLNNFIINTILFILGLTIFSIN